MEESRNKRNEKIIWELYLKKCDEEGKEPSIGDFTAWAKLLVTDI